MKKCKFKAKDQAKAKVRRVSLRVMAKPSVVFANGHILPKSANGNRAPATHVVGRET